MWPSKEAQISTVAYQGKAAKAREGELKPKSQKQTDTTRRSAAKKIRRSKPGEGGARTEGPIISAKGGP